MGKNGIDFKELEYHSTYEDEDCVINFYLNNSVTDEDYNERIMTYYKTRYKI